MNHKILTVDDSRTVRIIVRKAFRPFDCTIVEAAHGAEGLAIAARESPALILLDVTMPGMDGIEMLCQLKANPVLAPIPVIMLTAEGSQEQIQRALHTGARDYIPKPFKEDLLIERVRNVIELSQGSAPATLAPATA
ncbi:MAG: response regulator [Opitutaceae bacterium]